MLDFRQIEWDQQLDHDCRTLLQLALEEDLAGQCDWTTEALVPPNRQGAAEIVAREPGVVAGLAALPIIFDVANAQLSYETSIADGENFVAGTTVATLRGRVQDLLTCERTLLNLLGRLFGIATLTRRYVEKVQGTTARIYDTRKTTPGWRRLEKYAVRCGGAFNHRAGLYDAILIKDNHLAGRQSASGNGMTATAVRDARAFLKNHREIDGLIVEIEVDTLEQLAEVLSVGPDIVLLDNMPLDALREAVAMRDAQNKQIQLEASGGVQLETLREIAMTGVDRISVGALTHSARSLDLGLDWKSA